MYPRLARKSLRGDRNKKTITILRACQFIIVGVRGTTGCKLTDWHAAGSFGKEKLACSRPWIFEGLILVGSAAKSRLRVWSPGAWWSGLGWLPSLRRKHGPPKGFITFSICSNWSSRDRPNPQQRAHLLSLLFRSLPIVPSRRRSTLTNDEPRNQTNLCFSEVLKPVTVSNVCFATANWVY